MSTKKSLGQRIRNYFEENMTDIAISLACINPNANVCELTELMNLKRR